MTIKDETRGFLLFGIGLAAGHIDGLWDLPFWLAAIVVLWTWPPSTP